jgi:hypothetical protein
MWSTEVAPLLENDRRAVIVVSVVDFSSVGAYALRLANNQDGFWFAAASP